MEQDLPFDQQALARVFEAYPGVEAVYLFGSMATGRHNRLSDIDLAGIPKDSTVRDKKLDLLGDLVDAGFENVDLVILDQDDPVLNYAAVSPNVLVYSTEDFNRGTTFSNTVRRYLDLQPLLERQRKAYKKRLLGD